MNLLLRTDATVPIGTGHVMRCLALAQAWQDAGGKAVFAIAKSTPGLQERLAEESCEMLSVSAEIGTREDVERTVAEARKLDADWLVVDGYHFAEVYREGLKSAGMRVLFVDDYGHAQEYSSDVVLNQNVCATAALYPQIGQTTRLLLGSRYALLRREFVTFGRRDRVGSSVCRRLLLLMGGSDPENVTARAIEAVALARIEGLKTTVLVGRANQQLDALQRFVGASGLAITIVRDARNVPELMAGADVALSAAGSTCWELCFFGVPSLLVDVAENQTRVATEMDRIGCAIHVGGRSACAEEMAEELRRLCQDDELRSSLSKRSRELVDGKGATRVVSFLRGAKGLRLRPIAADDSRLLWEWANDPDVRAASFSPDRIPWETHIQWFEEKVRKRESLTFIAEDCSARPFGQVRFDFQGGGDADVNVSLARVKRGCGLAAPLITAAVQELFATTNCRLVHAFVKPDNTSSIKSFEKAGFTRVGIEQVRGNTAIRFDLRAG